MSRTKVERNYPYELMNAKEALNLARFASGKPHSKIAEEMGVGTETVRRYHTDPTYNPPLPRIPELNRAYGNDILIQWLARKCGGIFIRAEGVKRPQELHKEVGLLSKKFASVLEAYAEATEGKDKTKLQRLAKEAEELFIKAAEFYYAVKGELNGHKD